MAQLTKDKTQTSALRVAGSSEHGSRAARLGLWNAASFIQDVNGAEVFALFMFVRIAGALAQYAMDSSFVEQGVNQRGEASTSAWADLWRDVWREIDACRSMGDSLSVCKVKTHRS